VINASVASNHLTLEAWVKPLNTSQSGPAAIVALSEKNNKRNFTLGQGGNSYRGVVRTSSTGQTGSELASANGTATTNLTHVVFTRDAAGAVRTYVNGTLSTSGTIGGNLSSWDTSYRLGIANQLDSSQAWRGELHLVAVYSRALSAAEVSQNFLAGSD
jgi:hypothetical protein